MASGRCPNVTREPSFCDTLKLKSSRVQRLIRKNIRKQFKNKKQKMKKHITAAGMAVLMALAANAQVGQWQSQNTTLQFLPGKIVVLRGGDGVEAFSSINKQNPAFLDEYDPVTLNQVNPLVSVELPTNNGPASLWLNASAGSEGQGLARSIDRRYILMTGYTSPTDRSKNGGPPSTYDFNRGFGIVDAFTNLDVVYSDPEFWFGG